MGIQLGPMAHSGTFTLWQNTVGPNSAADVGASMVFDKSS